MIKKFKNEDIEEVMNIWLKTNIKFHEFIPKEYWYDNFKEVEKILPKALIYVFKEDNIIKGFIGLTNNQIEGLFVLKEYQRDKIGNVLLNKAKSLTNFLTLKVYIKNKIAINFYEKNGFKIIKKELDETINEYEYIMKWTN